MRKDRLPRYADALKMAALRGADGGT